MVQPPRLFFGKPWENFDTWLEGFSLIAVNNQWSERNLFLLVGLYFEGNARARYEDLQRSHPYISWSEAKNRLKAMFRVDSNMVFTQPERYALDADIMQNTTIMDDAVDPDHLAATGGTVTNYSIAPSVTKFFSDLVVDHSFVECIVQEDHAILSKLCLSESTPFEVVSTLAKDSAPSVNVLRDQPLEQCRIQEHSFVPTKPCISESTPFDAVKMRVKDPVSLETDSVNVIVDQSANSMPTTECCLVQPSQPEYSMIPFNKCSELSVVKSRKKRQANLCDSGTFVARTSTESNSSSTAEKSVIEDDNLRISRLRTNVSRSCSTRITTKIKLLRPKKEAAKINRTKHFWFHKITDLTTVSLDPDPETNSKIDCQTWLKNLTQYEYWISNCQHPLMTRTRPAIGIV